MRALVMAAGLGTRLKPLTDQTPKPLVPLLGRPMVTYVLDHLAAGGVAEATINIHYLPEQMRTFVAAWNDAGKLPKLFIQDETARILGSGGAAVKAAGWLFEKDDYALVCNADVLAAPDLRALEATHRRLREQGVETTLTVMPHPEAGRKYNGLLVAGDHVTAFAKPGLPDTGLFHFPGFYIVDKKARPRFPALGEDFSVVEVLWAPMAREGKLGAYRYDGHYLDLGTVADLKAAEEFLDA